MNPAPLIPFLKWPGGKRWLVDRYRCLFDVGFDRFVEPFLGSGAVYFRLAPNAALLSDSNVSLIQTFCTIRDNWRSVVRHLKQHHRDHNERYYYQVRSFRPRSAATHAARMIYLNRTCWNGLYRVNLKGEFNVPIGTKSNVLLDTDDFARTSSLLSHADLKVCDFAVTLTQAGKGDFVFLDPPYTIQHNNNGFIKYNEGLFSWEDQIRLKESAVAASRRGAKVLITNANHDSLRQLYRGCGDLMVIERPSVLSGLSSARGRFEELVIKCY
jgi:DNA adenine methylase